MEYRVLPISRKKVELGEGDTSEDLHGCASLSIYFLSFLRCLPFTPRGYSECHNPPSEGET